MISDRKLRLIVISCLIIMSGCLGYAWYLIEKNNMPSVFGFCLIGILASLYYLGLTFDRYRRALYAEAVNLYQQKQITVSDLQARLHVRDITIDKCRESIEALEEREAKRLNTEFELKTRVISVIENLDKALATFTPNNGDKA